MADSRDPIEQSQPAPVESEDADPVAAKNRAGFRLHPQANTDPLAAAISTLADAASAAFSSIPNPIASYQGLEE